MHPASARRFLVLHATSAVVATCLSQSIVIPPASAQTPSHDAFSACFPPESLKSTRKEHKPRKGIRRYDRAPAATPLSPHEPIPLNLRGAIRRVDISDGRKRIALTLDLCEQPGEVAGYDAPIFDYLREQNIKATIFTGGKWMRSHPKRMAQLIADPLFEIGNHAEAHRNLRGLRGKRLVAEILNPQRAYEAARKRLISRSCMARHPQAIAALPHRIGLFRFPFGACDDRSLELVAKAGLLAIQWDLSTGDPAPTQSAKAIARQMVRLSKPGSIILAHANGRGYNTARALPLAIPKLIARGFEFVTVSELLAAGTPVITKSCYNQRPGDTDRYDKYFTRVRRTPRRKK